MIEWLIVGGGIHGTYISNVLTALVGISPDDIRILDPHGSLLSMWRHNTENCGMKFLRSPATHNIDLGIMSIHQFSKTDRGRPYSEFIPPYFRPSLDLFNRHCIHVIETRRLDDMRIQGRAVSLRRLGSAVAVETEAFSLKSRNIVLAIGLGEQPCWPDWAIGLRNDGARIFHLFDPSFFRRELKDLSHTVVVGGGISALQTALKLATENRGRITLVSRHPPRLSVYDFDPCWIGPKCLNPFYEHSHVRRRQIVDTARIRGSVPPEVYDAFQNAIQSGRLNVATTRKIDANLDSGGILLKLDSNQLRADQVILATGFLSTRPGGAFIRQAVAEFHLRCNPCGYPVIDKDLRWHDRIHVMGPLAELQLGPCARNIVGARNAGRLLTHYLKTR
jgi:thioredoxin reductase